jgi:hypothetical protein
MFKDHEAYARSVSQVVAMGFDYKGAIEAPVVYMVFLCSAQASMQEVCEEGALTPCDGCRIFTYSQLQRITRGAGLRVLPRRSPRTAAVGRATPLIRRTWGNELDGA